jgi:predicted RNA-binding protein with PIN domain
MNHMASKIIIDGYNFMWASNPFRDEAIGNLETGRNELLKWLSQQETLRNFEVTVVFDAHHTESSHPTQMSHQFIRILFSSGGQTADDLIRELAAELGPSAIVISSDREVMRNAEKKGCGVLGSREFQNVVEHPENFAVDPGHKLPKGKRKALAKLLPKFPDVS